MAKLAIVLPEYHSNIVYLSFKADDVLIREVSIECFVILSQLSGFHTDIQVPVKLIQGMDTMIAGRDGLVWNTAMTLSRFLELHAQSCALYAVSRVLQQCDMHG